MDKWIAKEHQVNITSEAMPILNKFGIVYLAMEERTGKTIIAIMLAEADDKVKDVLVVTTKKALDGWTETLSKFEHKKNYTLINYESAKNVKGLFHMVFIDEAHRNISSFPKLSATWLVVKKYTNNTPIVYMSATPHAQGTALLYHQLKLSSFSPWKEYKDFYTWYKEYAVRKEDGDFYTIRIGPTQTAIDYKKVDHARIKKEVAHLFISYTRKQLGFEQEPKDVLHFITLGPKTKEAYNTLVKKKAFAFTLMTTGEDYNLVCDSAAKLRWALHMLEGGVLKIGEEHVNLGCNEKVDYILANWGDKEDLAIMYHFKADLVKLSKYFKKAKLYQATTYAEGVDLSHIRHLVIYSQDHSTAKHTQRRARQANINRKEEIKVHFILVKGAASEKVYKSVSVNKVNFVDTVFETI